VIRFSALLEALVYQPARTAKLALLVDYFAHTPDPDRGYALAALTGSLRFDHARPSLLRELARSRVDPVLFDLSYDYVGDMAETIALIWPAKHGANAAPRLADVIHELRLTGRIGTPQLITKWLDALDPNGRWALIKLLSGGLRVGVSARLAKTAVARFGDLALEDVEEVWHGLAPPFSELFAWAEGRGPKPVIKMRAPFSPVMLACAIDDRDFQSLKADDFRAEWKWDGIRVQAVSDGGVRKLYSRSGDDISDAFPDVLEAMVFEGTIDGELLVVRDGMVAPFGDLQKRLNRRSVTMRLLDSHPVAVKAYDLLREGGDDVRGLGFDVRRMRLERLIDKYRPDRFSLSPLIAFSAWETLADLRAGRTDPGVEGLILKHKDSPYTIGRVKGMWYKWKRDPFVIDAVLMYAQRGHGKRSSFYSDLTFGVWQTTSSGEELVPVGKAYFGFTDEELKDIDRFIRAHTVKRFGPVCEVVHEPETGLVFEIAFEGLNRSTRHKSGIAMRFPRIHRIRHDKPPRDADRIASLQALLPPA